MKKKKRVIKALLWVILAVVLLIVLGYFVYSCVRLNDKSIPLEHFAQKSYITQDYGTTLEFSSDARRITVLEGTEATEYEAEYAGNIFTLRAEGASEIYIIAIDERTLFSDSGEYFYLWNGDEE